MYMFRYYSLNHPTLLLPTEPKSLFFMFVSPLLPCTRRKVGGIQDGGDRGGIPMANSC